MLFFIFIVYLIQVTTNYVVGAESRTNFDVKRLEKCATNGSVKYSINITKQNQHQYLDASLLSPIPLDNNIALNVIIQSALDGHTFLPLFTIREKDFCKALNKYMGELWYDIERAAQVPVGVCPILEGNYHVHHLLLKFEKVSLQTFPFGTLRFSFRGIDKRNFTIQFCEMLEVENVIN